MNPDFQTEDGRIQLFFGDCLEIMPNLSPKSIDMVLCDLPYGVTSCSWDSPLPLNTLWKQYSNLTSGSCVLFGSQPFTTELILSNRDLYKYSLVWVKNVPTGMAQAKYRPMKYHEDILVFGSGKYNPQMQSRVGDKKGCYKYPHYCGPNNHVNLSKQPKLYDPDFVLPGSVLTFKVVPNRSRKLHPTQKPVALCEYLIKTYTNEDDTVLDNCFGSGTTAIACLNTNRRFIGIEKERKYFDLAVERIQKHLSQNSYLIPKTI